MIKDIQLFIALVKTDLDRRKQLDRSFSWLPWITDRSFYIWLSIRIGTTFKSGLGRLFFGLLIHKPAQFLLGFSVPRGAQIGGGLVVFHGDNILINHGVIIGKNLTLYSRVCIGERFPNDKCPVIGDNVVIGTGACVLGPLFIQDNSRISANSLVTPRRITGGASTV